MNLLNISNVISWSAQVAAIVAAALLALKLTRLDAPAVRYVFLRIVLAVCLLLPFVQPYALAPSGSGTTSSGVLRGPAAPSGRRAPSADSQLIVGAGALFAPSQQWPATLAVLLIAGAGARLLWIGAGVIRLRRLRRAGEAACVNDACDDLQRIIEVSPTIRYVAALGQPVTFGFRRPVVLLPESMKEEPASIQRAVLAHELWHVRRRDWIWTVAEEALRAVFWFHPAVWILLSRIQRTREEVVDELAILATGSRRNYLNALLAYADRPSLIAATAFARRRHLMHRMILITKEKVMSARRVVTCGALAAAVVMAAGVYSIHAFPLTESQAAESLPSLKPGPIELQAKPITPENPIPRRTYHVPADYPTEAEAIGLRSNVTVRLTLDESGRIAETRIVGFATNIGDKFGMSMTSDSTGRFSGKGFGAAGVPPELSRVSPEQSRAALERVFDAALRAVRQWQYAPPAEGPIAFSVNVPVGAESVGGMPPPPPPPPPPGGTAAWQTSDAIRVGGDIKPPLKVYNVSPIYPPDAQSSRVQGVVIIEARIERDGSVSETRILRSIPMLDDAAVDAVRQWKFTPTLLNGVAVPVIMTTTVNFVLQ
jgi:TonB family protein